MYQEGQAMADAVFVLYFFQPLATRNALLTFLCTDRFDDGSMFLLADPNLSCDSTAHTVMTVYAALMVIIWPVGVTCVFLVLLRWDKVRNFNSKSGTDHALRTFSRGLNTYMETKECDFGSLFTICDRDGDGILSREDLLWAMHLLLPLTTSESALHEHADHLMSEFGLQDRRGNEYIELDGLLAPGKVHFHYFNDPRRAAVQFLRQGYKEQYWYWEIVMCGARLWLAAILLGIYRGDISQFVTALFSVFVIIMIQCSLEPSATFRGHLMALLSYIHLFWVLIYGAFVRQNSLENAILCGCILFVWLLATLGYYLNSTSSGMLVYFLRRSRARSAVVPVMNEPLEVEEETNGQQMVLQGDRGQFRHDAVENEAEFHDEHSVGDTREEAGDFTLHEKRIGNGLSEVRRDDHTGQPGGSFEADEGDRYSQGDKDNETTVSAEELSCGYSTDDNVRSSDDGPGNEEEGEEEEEEEEEDYDVDSDFEDQDNVDDGNRGSDEDNDDESSEYSSDEWEDFDAST